MLSDFQKTILFSTLVISFLSYSAFIYTDLFRPFENNTQADHGKKIWQEKNCIACHQIYQLGGYLGPDLTNIYSKKGPHYITAFVQNGSEVMPKFDLNESEMNALLAYFQKLDATGNADPRTFKISINGMTQQQTP